MFPPQIGTEFSLAIKTWAVSNSILVVVGFSFLTVEFSIQIFSGKTFKSSHFAIPDLFTGESSKSCEASDELEDLEEGKIVDFEAQWMGKDWSFPKLG